MIDSDEDEIGHNGEGMDGIDHEGAYGVNHGL